jgi:hypothetical protein
MKSTIILVITMFCLTHASFGQPTNAARPQITTKERNLSATGIPEWSSLDPAEIVNSKDAEEAQVQIGWAAFKNHEDWYSSPVCGDKRWHWQISMYLTDQQKGQLYYYDGYTPACRSEAFAIVAIEYLAKQDTRVDTAPQLVVGGHFDPSTQLTNTAIPGVVADPPIGNDRRSGEAQYIAYTMTNNQPVVFYSKDVLIRKLWFLTGSEMKEKKFTLLIPKYKPVRFTVPGVQPDR